MEERPFCFNVFWGDEKKRPHVEFSRRGSHYCIYCGAKSDSREHCPSKVFLSKPYPDNLPVLPACIKCNNGFLKVNKLKPSGKKEMLAKDYINGLNNK